MRSREKGKSEDGFARSRLHVSSENHKQQRVHVQEQYKELSEGDANRRETTRRILKLRTDQEKMSQLTFRPKLNVDANLHLKRNHDCRF